MSAISVPKEKSSIQVGVTTNPSLDGVPNGRGVLVKVLRIGIDGSDEIKAGEYGATHPGYDFLVFGHAGFGQVQEVGPNVTQLKPGDYVVATSRTPYTSERHQIGNEAVSSMSAHDEQGLNLLTEYYVADACFTAKVPDSLKHLGGLLEPSPTGAAISGKTSALLFQAVESGITISPLRLNPKLPWKLEQIISKLLNQDSALCYRGAEELRSMIERLGRGAERTGISALRATLAWRRPGAQWHFVPAGRSCMVISRLFEAPQCGIAPGLRQSEEGRLGLDWLSAETPLRAPASGSGFPVAAR